jgi:hypothetical protein
MNALVFLEAAGHSDYFDDDLSDNRSALTVYADAPPVLSGSKKLILRGLPKGCPSADFSLLVVAKAARAKKVVFAMVLVDEHGNGGVLIRSAKGRRLRVLVPVSKLVPQLGQKYEFKVRAKSRGRTLMTTTVTFERC